MRRTASILTLLAFATIGTGALSRLHQAAHEQLDHQAGSHARCHHRHHHHERPEAPPRHDESNCLVHAMLAAPLLHATPPTPLLLRGTFVEHVKPPPVGLVGRPNPLPVSCRGPPSLPASNNLA